MPLEDTKEDEADNQLQEELEEQKETIKKSGGIFGNEIIKRRPQINDIYRTST